jgi:hypothetical protein
MWRPNYLTHDSQQNITYGHLQFADLLRLDDQSGVMSVYFSTSAETSSSESRYCTVRKTEHCRVTLYFLHLEARHIIITFIAKREALTAALMKSQIFWNVMPWRLISSYSHFGR